MKILCSKNCKSLKEAARFQAKLYTLYDTVRLVDFPRFTESGTYTWRTANAPDSVFTKARKSINRRLKAASKPMTRQEFNPAYFHDWLAAQAAAAGYLAGLRSQARELLDRSNVCEYLDSGDALELITKLAKDPNVP